MHLAIACSRSQAKRARHTGGGSARGGHCDECTRCRLREEDPGAERPDRRAQTPAGAAGASVSREARDSYDTVCFQIIRNLETMHD